MATFQEVLDIQGSFSYAASIGATKNVDLVSLLPARNQQDQLLVELFEEVGWFVGTWLTDIDNISELLDPSRVGDGFVDKLASLIGLVLIKDENTDIVDERQMLVQAIDWYKIKGTYDALKAISGLNNLNVTIRDRYCPPGEATYNDYAQYLSADWFVALNPGENPPGIQDSFIKTSHFEYDITLNRVYGADFAVYLWKEVVGLRVQRLIECVRPINTVPHKILSVYPVTKLDGATWTVDGEIQSCVHGDWQNDRLFFDTMTTDSVIAESGDLVVANIGSDQVIADVSSLYFDQVPPLNFDWGGDHIVVTQWRLGTGHKSRNVLEDLFSAATPTALAGHTPDYVESGNSWTDPSSGWLFQDGVLTPTEGSLDEGSQLILGASGSVYKYSTYISGKYSRFLFRKSGGFALGVELAWVGHWRFQMTQPSGYGPISDWLGGFVGWHDVEIHDDGAYVSVWVDGVLMVDRYYITQCQGYTGIGFTRPSYDTSTKFRSLTVDYQRDSGVGFALEHEVLSGTGILTTIFPDYVQYEFSVIPAAVQAGISEMGLYLTSDIGTLRIASVFPTIDKLDGYELRFIVKVYSL